MSVPSQLGGGTERAEEGKTASAGGTTRPTVSRGAPVSQDGGVNKNRNGVPVHGRIQSGVGDGDHDVDGEDVGVGPELVGHPGLEAEKVRGEDYEGEGALVFAPGVVRPGVPEAGRRQEGREPLRGVHPWAREECGEFRRSLPGVQEVFPVSGATQVRAGGLQERWKSWPRAAPGDGPGAATERCKHGGMAPV